MKTYNEKNIYGRVALLERELKKIKKNIVNLEKLDLLKTKKYKKFFTKVKMEIKEINDALKLFKTQLKELNSRFASEIKTHYDIARKDMNEYLERHKDIFEEKLSLIEQQLDEFNKKIVNATELVNDNLVEFESRIEDKFSEFSASKIDKISFDNSIYALNSQIKELADLLNNTRKEILSLSEVLNKKVDFVNDSLGGKIQKEIDALDEKFSANILNFDEKIKSFENEVQVKLKDIEFSLDTKLDKINKDLELKMEKSFENFKEVIKTIKENVDLKDEDIIEKLSSLEKDFSEKIVSLKTETFDTFSSFQKEINTKLDETKRYLNEKILAFQNIVEKIESDYNEILNLNMAFKTLVNSLDKRLTELSEKFNSKISEIKDSFEEKIKHSSDYAVRLIDDLSGYVEEKLSHIDSKKISEIDERLNIFSERYNELSKNLSELANVQKKIDEIRDESMKSISEIENKLNEKFLKIEEVNLEKFKELENLARNKVDYGLITQNIDAINDKIKMLSEDFQDKINKIFSDFIAKTRELEIFTNEIKFELHHLRERNQDVDLKISFLEKNQNEIATILKTQINQSFSELKDEFSQRIKDLYGMLDELKQKYYDSLEFETTIVTLVNSLDKRLTELSENFNSKISEIKDSFEEKIKHSSDYAVRLIDDLSGYLDSKLSEINSKVEIAETENYKQDRSSVTHLEESLTNLLERYKELINTISNFDEKLMQVREELDKKISEIKTNNQIMFSVLETKIIEKINEKVSKIDQINSERIKELEKNFTNIKSLNFLDKDTFSENIKFFEERLNNLESSVSRLHQSNEEMDRKIEKILYEKMNMLKAISEKLNTSIQSIESLEEKVSNLNLELEERKNKEFSLRQDFEKSNNLLYNKYDELRFFVNSEIKKISSLIEDIKKERLAEDTATQKEMQEIRLKLLRLVEEVDSLKTQLSNYNEAIYLLKDNFNKDIKNEVSIVGKNVDFLNKEVLNLSEKLKNIEKVEKQINDLNAFKYNLLENTENITRLLLIKESEIYKKIKEESESLLKTLSSLRLQLKETREMVSYMKDDFLQKLGNLEEIIKSFSISDKSNNFAKNIDFGDIIVRIKRMESLEERIDKLHALVEDVDKKIMLINEEMWKDVEIKMRSTIQELDNRISEIEKKLDRFQKENKSILDKEIYELKMLKELMGKFMEESKKELNTLRKGVEEKLYHQNFDEEAILKYLERLKNE